MIHELVGVIERKIIESFEAHIEADSAEEAQDILYDVLSEYPDSELSAERLLKIRVEGERPTSVAIEYRGELEENDDEDEED